MNPTHLAKYLRIATLCGVILLGTQADAQNAAKPKKSNAVQLDHYFTNQAEPMKIEFKTNLGAHQKSIQALEAEYQADLEKKIKAIDNDITSNKDKLANARRDAENTSPDEVTNDSNLIVDLTRTKDKLNSELAQLTTTKNEHISNYQKLTALIKQNKETKFTFFAHLKDPTQYVFTNTNELYSSDELEAIWKKYEKEATLDFHLGKSTHKELQALYQKFLPIQEKLKSDNQKLEELKQERDKKPTTPKASNTSVITSLEVIQKKHLDKVNLEIASYQNKILEDKKLAVPILIEAKAIRIEMNREYAARLIKNGTLRPLHRELPHATSLVIEIDKNTSFSFRSESSDTLFKGFLYEYLGNDLEKTISKDSLLVYQTQLKAYLSYWNEVEKQISKLPK